MKSLLTFLICIIFCNQVYSQILFENSVEAIGLDENCGVTYLGNGISFVDFDNDGWDDISLATAYGMPVRFFKNINGQFIEQTLNIPNTNYQTKQINWVDFDNDNDKDLFITSDTNGNRLLENDGSFNFTDITQDAGLPLGNMLTYGASWGDINNDGFLDVYISNRDTSANHTNKLYKNNGNGTFSDISVSAGVDLAALSFCSAFFDYDNDGYQDIYISNDKLYTTNVLYRNNGDETFTDVSQASQTDLIFDAMTVTIGDYNNDGWFDIYVSNNPDGNALLNNNGDGTFTDVAGTSGTLFNSVGWGSVFLDADNDKDLDLYVSGSLDGTDPGLISSAFYENVGATFNVPNNAGFSMESGESYSNAIGDINNDGKPDIAVSNSNNEDIYLWKNLTTTSNNWLKVKLKGVESNLEGIGSTIEITINGEKQYRYVLCGEGYLSQNSNTEFFGLGENTNIDSIKVTWLSGTEDIFTNVSANQILEITEGSETLSLNTDIESFNFNLFPNPASNFITVLSDFEIDNLEIYNLVGKRILSLNTLENGDRLNVTDLKSGLYFLKISSNGINHTEKFVKK